MGRLAFYVIVLFCGIPGSGKTTIATLLAERLARVGRVELLSSDNLRAPVYKKIFRAIAADRDPADVLILDATFFKKELRREVKSRARSEKVLTIYLDCPLEVALERNRSRQPNISEKALHIMFRCMEPPRHPTLRIETATTTADDAAGKIYACIEND